LSITMADYDAQPGRKPPAERERSRAQMEADEVDLHAGLWRYTEPASSPPAGVTNLDQYRDL
jgi:hypothetical protein